MSRSTVRFVGNERGFTLLEMVVAMGLLTTLLMVLVRLLSTGATLFDEGERGQESLDRGQAAARAAEAVFGDSSGPRLIGRPAAASDARLLVHRLALGADPLHTTRVPVIRTTVRMPAADEERLLLAAFETAAHEDGLDGQDALDAARERLATWPRTGRGESLLVPWPSEPTATFFDLRRVDRLDDPLLDAALDTGAGPRLVEIARIEDLAMDGEALRATSRVVATGLLHFDVALWSQRTRQWGGRGLTGAEVTWDSARAGLLIDEKNSADDFGLDLFPASLRDARDDVWPRWVRVTIVVGRSPTAPPDAYLTAALSEDETTMTVSRPEEMPDPATMPYVKIGTEWVRFGAVRGRDLDALQRGQRGTSAIAHPSGTPVRVGRTIVLDLPLAHGRNADD